MKVLILFLLLISSLLNAKHIHKEKYYQTIFCNKFKGIKEYRLSDKARVDCLTYTYAIEVDFAPKWAESIGQSLYYGLMTNKQAGVLLILEHPQKDIKYLNRLKKVALKHGIKIWTIDNTRTIKRVR